MNRWLEKEGGEEKEGREWVCEVSESRMFEEMRVIRLFFNFDQTNFASETKCTSPPFARRQAAQQQQLREPPPPP